MTPPRPRDRFVIVVADPSRPAYEKAAREVLNEPGWEVRMASGFDDDELVGWASVADVLITRRDIFRAQRPTGHSATVASA